MHYNLWADGACSNNGKKNAVGGWAYVIVDPYRRILKRNSAAEAPSTNNRMELISVIEGLKEFDALNLDGFSTCTVYTDSAYLFNCKEQNWYKGWERNGWKNYKGEPVKNPELWRELIPYFDRNNITWTKVRGHKGISFNEMVDEMAVAARKEYENDRAKEN